MTINALFLFITILAITGLGVDLMRFERNRSILQYTVDRAVLAAADLDQTIPPQQVVEAYL
ncbi:MAG: TadE/TadG family type IV pilus assembly protein, partial [Ruegeria sp.]